MASPPLYCARHVRKQRGIMPWQWVRPQKQPRALRCPPVSERASRRPVPRRQPLEDLATEAAAYSVILPTSFPTSLAILPLYLCQASPQAAVEDVLALGRALEDTTHTALLQAPGRQRQAGPFPGGSCPQVRPRKLPLIPSFSQPSSSA